MDVLHPIGLMVRVLAHVGQGYVMGLSFRGTDPIIAGVFVWYSSPAGVGGVIRGSSISHRDVTDWR